MSPRYRCARGGFVAVLVLGAPLLGQGGARSRMLRRPRPWQRPMQRRRLSRCAR